MEFYAGVPEDIGRAFTEYELDDLRNGSTAHAYADLSLHLSPDHLDLLCDEVAASSSAPSIRLLDALERHVGGTEGESSADVVSNEWVASIAAVADSEIPALAKRWLRSVAQDVGDPSVGEDASHAEAAVADLVRLCRAALRRETRVVFAWYL